MRLPTIPRLDQKELQDSLYATAKELQADVARGAAWLDGEFPGWERRIDLGILNIDVGKQCICGQVVPSEMLEAAKSQLSGHYYSGYGLLTRESSGAEEWAHGFLGNEHADYWVTLIKERFDTGALSDS